VTTELLAGVGPAALGVELDLGLPPHHPTSHGGLRLRLGLDGDVVVSADPEVGFMHRGAEKLLEVRDYRQGLALANRHDWLSAFAGELGLCLAVEKALRLVPPPRASWLRVVHAELTRALHHLAFLGGWAQRERLQQVVEEATGGRIHVMTSRVGGFREDVPAGWEARCEGAVRAVLVELEALGDKAITGAPEGVGVLPLALAESFGAGGPVGRASGLALDVRVDDPYAGYGSLEVAVVTRSAGDCRARYEVLVAETRASLELVLDALGSLPAGPVNVRLPKTVRVPEGESYAWTEAPGGPAGWWLVSRGGPTPWRLKMRTPSFAHAQLLGQALPGARLQDVPAILGSLFLVAGDIDR
jgi:NADH-quinone oxidoreductase subunit D